MSSRFVKIPINYFDELSKEVQEKIIESELGQSFASFDADCSIKYILDEWGEKLYNLGFENSEILYNIGFSQGDGACFTTKYVNLLKLAQAYNRIFNLVGEKDEDSLACLNIEINQSGRYSHENSIYCHIEYNSYNDEDEFLDEEIEDLERAILSIAKELSREIYKEMSESVLGCYDPENIAEGIRANDCIFDSLGNCMNRYESILEEE